LLKITFDVKEGWLGLLEMPNIIYDSIFGVKICHLDRRNCPMETYNVHTRWRQTPSNNRKKLLMAIDVRLNFSKITFYHVFATMFNKK
jgi:hypothetical protein